MSEQPIAKIEAENALKWKVKKEKIKQDKIEAKKKRQKELLQPNVKNNIINWIDKNNDGAFYIGMFGKEKCFEIKRGALTFSLKIIHKELVSDKKNFNSTELIKLQKSANEVLWKNPEFLRKFKPIS